MSDHFLSRVRELKFKQLIVFEQAMALGSTHKAAEALNMSQPNVYKIIVQLEELLGVSLFDRNSKGLVPTVFAEHLVDRVRVMLGDARTLGRELAGLRNGERGKVTVGTLISASASLLPASIALMKSRFPLVDIIVREANNDILFPMLLTGELDVIVGRLPDFRHDEVQYHSLYLEELAIVTRGGHPLSGLAMFNPSELGKYPWIVPSRESPVRRLLEDFFARQGIAWPENEIESLSMLTNLGILRQSDTIAVLPRSAALPFVEAGTLHELMIDYSVPFGLVGYSIKADRKPTPAGRAFIQALQEVGAGFAASRKS